MERDYDADAADILRSAVTAIIVGLHAHFEQLHDVSAPMPEGCGYDYLEAYRAAQGAYERVMGLK